jgi:hypothetical protein
MGLLTPTWQYEVHVGACETAMTVIEIITPEIRRLSLAKITAALEDK